MAKTILTFPALVSLRGRDEISREINPDPDTLADMAAELGLLGLRKLRVAVTLSPVGARDWALRGTLGATVVQPCVVTLAPVTTRIETEIARNYRADYVEPDAAEVEMLGDENDEPLPETLELGEVVTEALALSLPDFPKADGAELDQSTFAAPGVTPMSDEDAKPFAGLAELRDTLGKSEN